MFTEGILIIGRHECRYYRSTRRNLCRWPARNNVDSWPANKYLPLAKDRWYLRWAIEKWILTSGQWEI